MLIFHYNCNQFIHHLISLVGNYMFSNLVTHNPRATAKNILNTNMLRVFLPSWL